MKEQKPETTTPMQPFLSPNLSISPAPEATADREVTLATFTYTSRREVLPLLAESLGAAGCWLLERRATGQGTIQFRFEAPLQGIVEVYTTLIATGLELTREGHLQLTALCGLPFHTPRLSRARTLTVRLDVSFMDEMDQPAIRPTVGAA
jgi:hypothetical protein